METASGACAGQSPGYGSELKEIKQNETNENNHLTKYFYIIKYSIPDHVYNSLTVFCDTILKQAFRHKIGLEFFMKEAYD